MLLVQSSDPKGTSGGRVLRQLIFVLATGGTGSLLPREFALVVEVPPAVGNGALRHTTAPHGALSLSQRRGISCIVDGLPAQPGCGFCDA
jgi:hypothetical protein